MRKTAKGFTLFEVLVSMFITGVALLGLAQMEVYILKSSQSSFNYTVATIRANSFVDAVWAGCYAQSSSASGTYGQIRQKWRNEITSAGMLTQADSPPASYAQSTDVTVSWTDRRFNTPESAANNTLTLNVTFPYSSCGS
ncbi:MAG: type IV pilus assembly protein PilV [Psychromonas sp.]|jgi:type IV pilus assembly protein PilV|uniref:type IV pilus modification PilV family protein n=1 Tax=Psychromonas sp. TaxID=1884585 RepID=UPI0039E65555